MNWFRVVDEKMYLSPKKSAILTESYIAIHNYLKTEADVCYSSSNISEQTNLDLEWEQESGLFYRENDNSLTA